MNIVDVTGGLVDTSTVEVSRRQSMEARSEGSLCIFLKNDERTTGNGQNNDVTLTLFY